MVPSESGNACFIELVINSLIIRPQGMAVLISSEMELALTFILIWEVSYEPDKIKTRS